MERAFTGTPDPQRLRARTVGWSLAVVAGSLCAAFGGALLTGTAIGTVVGGVESLSASSGGVLQRISILFPFGFAFSAGMVATVNPCGFAMLPAYLGLFLGDASDATTFATERLSRAVAVGGVVTFGFVLVFGIVGLPIALGARGLINFFPWIGFGVGVLLAIAGAYTLAGGKFYAALAARLSAKIGGANQANIGGYFAFGLGYGVASLSCTLPIFLAVVGNTVTTGTFPTAMLQFLLYGLGMGSVGVGLTLSITLFRGAMVGVLRKALPYVPVVGAAMLVLSGTFIVYYWLTVGGLLDTLGLA